jgi:hypothetical protein
MHFVLRLNPTVRARLNAEPSGSFTPAEVAPERVAAFGTYLHETVHWWQHMGSTLGLILSLSFPAQTHTNHSMLKSLTSGVGLIKSLRQLPDHASYSDATDRVNVYHGSSIGIPPIGARELYEGQARFTQLQYLYAASQGRWDWSEFYRLGMLGKPYTDGFLHFLEVLREPFPSSVGNPLIGLFLVLCDMATNPTEGFPFDIQVFETFLIDVDPGTRFHLLCSIVAREHPNMKSAVRNHSDLEYEEITEVLSRRLAAPSPLAAARLISTWPKTNSAIASLMNEEATFTFLPINLPIRVLFARFIHFQMEKAKSPAYFVWPGIWMGAVRTDSHDPSEILARFGRHEALFMEAENGEVQPRLINDRPASAVQETFEAFYQWMSTYNLTRQWIAATGAFDFDFRWLAPSATLEQTRSWAAHNFQVAFGVDPLTFEIL